MEKVSGGGVGINKIKRTGGIHFGNDGDRFFLKRQKRRKED